MKPPEPIKPSEDQIRNCEASGWEYLGDNIFSNGEWLGWFTKEHGFWKE